MNKADLHYLSNYKVESGLGLKSAVRYHLPIEGELIYEDLDGNTPRQLVGKLSGQKFQLIHVINKHMDAYEIFQDDLYISELSELIYDEDNLQFSTAINDYFNDSVSQPNILLLDRIELLPEYQGFKIGQRWLKDFVETFGSDCGLVVIKCFPLQFEDEDYYERKTEWNKMMQYNLQEQDEETADYLLKKYFIKSGFSLISSLTNEYLFLCPDLKNEAFDAI